MFMPSSKSKERFRNNTRIKIGRTLNIRFIASIWEALIQHRNLPPHLRCPTSNPPHHRYSIPLQGAHYLSLCQLSHPLPGQSKELPDPITPGDPSGRLQYHMPVVRKRVWLRFLSVGLPLLWKLVHLLSAAP